MPIPREIAERQKKWLDEQKRKQTEKTAPTNMPEKIVKREPPKQVDVQIEPPRMDDAFAEARARFEALERQSQAPSPTPPASVPAAPTPSTRNDAMDSPGTQAAVIDDYFRNGIRVAIDRVW